MHTRVNTIFGEKDRVDAGIAQIEGPDRAAVEATSGNRGLTTVVDREGAVIIAISYWDEPDRSSQAELTRARQDAVAAAAGDLVAESYVLALDARASIPAPGATVGMLRVRITPSGIAGGLAYLRDEIVPLLRAAAGFHHVEVLIDQDLGNGLLITAWLDEEHAARADLLVGRLRGDALDRAGVTFSRTETYTLIRDAADTRVNGRT